jgi:membrane protease YdiL (CAAX protease family)
LFPDDLVIPEEIAQRIGMLIAAVVLVGLLINLFILSRLSHFRRVWRPRLRQLMARPWQGADVALVVTVVIALHAGGWLIFQLLGLLSLLPDGQDARATMMLHSLALHGGILFCIGFLTRIRKLHWRKAFGSIRWTAPLAAAALYLAAIPVLGLAALIYQLVLRGLGFEPEPQDVLLLFAEMDDDWLLLYMAVLAVLVAPVSEELLFRGLLLPAMMRQVGPRLAILAGSLLFAAIHFSVSAMAPLFIFAIALNLAYIYTRSLAVPIIMHMLFNAGSLFLIRSISEYL